MIHVHSTNDIMISEKGRGDNLISFRRVTRLSNGEGIRALSSTIVLPSSFYTPPLSANLVPNGRSILIFEAAKKPLPYDAARFQSQDHHLICALLYNERHTTPPFPALSHRHTNTHHYSLVPLPLY